MTRSTRGFERVLPCGTPVHGRASTCSSQGLTSATPRCSKLAVWRVTTMRSRVTAVAAIRTSRPGRGSGTCMRAAWRTVSRSTGHVRPLKAASRWCSSHQPSTSLWAVSRRSSRAMPISISMTVMTLIDSSWVDCRCAQARTVGAARAEGTSAVPAPSAWRALAAACATEPASPHSWPTSSVRHERSGLRRRSAVVRGDLHFSRHRGRGVTSDPGNPRLPLREQRPFRRGRPEGLRRAAGSGPTVRRSTRARWSRAGPAPPAGSPGGTARGRRRRP